MSLFDKMFKKNALDQKLDDAFEFVAENNPIMKKAKATVSEGQDQATRALRKEIYKATGKWPEEYPHADGEDGDPMQAWDSMFDQFFDQELSSIKICPSCGEAAPVEMDRCPKCGAQLPETTARDLVESWK